MAKKRANGEGNIRKRKDGRWEARYTAGHDPKTGKRIIKNVLGKTQAEVREKLKRALEETNGMDVARADDFTVATWLKTWYDLYAKPNVRVATADRYDLMINTYTIPRVGNIKLTKLTSRDLQKLYKDLMEKGRERKTKTGAQGLSSTTVRSVHLMLHCAFERAVKERLIPRMAGADLGGTDIENHARCIERSYKMLTLLENSVNLLRTHHQSGEVYYWILYYSFLSPQKLKNVEEIIEALHPHIRDISFSTYYRLRKAAVEALSSVLWGFSAQDTLKTLDCFFPPDV